MATRNAKLPSDVTFTRRNGGMWVKWNGRPEGQVYVTHSRDVAYGRVDENGEDDQGFSWQATPYQGASGSCRRTEIVKLAAEYLGA